RVQPGRLAQGPEEKQGFAGRTAGFWGTGIDLSPFASRRVRSRWGDLAHRRYTPPPRRRSMAATGNPRRGGGFRASLAAANDCAGRVQRLWSPFTFGTVSRAAMAESIHTTPHKIQAMVIGDSAVVARRVKDILKRTPDVDLAAEAVDGVEAVSKLRRNHL